MINKAQLSWDTLLLGMLGVLVQPRAERPKAWDVTAGRRDERTAVDNQYLHVPMVVEASEELGRDNKVLTHIVFLAGDPHHRIVNLAFALGVHTLIDLVDEAKGHARHGRQTQ